MDTSGVCETEGREDAKRVANEKKRNSVFSFRRIRPFINEKKKKDKRKKKKESEGCS